MKGTIKADHISVNKYQLLVLGMPPLTFTTISGIEDELEVVDLPDRTKASGGNRKAVEFTAKLPMHHIAEQAMMELWFLESQDPVSPLYKKVGTLIHLSISGNVLRTYSMTGIFPSKRALPELDMKNEGEMAEVEWTFQADNMLPI
jgi:hypothetical protein